MDDKKRMRKKQLYHDIVKQVEFYFSPANLSKDRFMFHALTENENGVELAVLLKCNKLRLLTTDIKILIKALRLSENLELTDNELRVRSKIPYTVKENVDECTIYVERVPLDANIDFMHQVFSQFGSVDYVSLPKFQTGKIKGFAFIEFSDPSAALKAIEEFRKTGCYLPIDMDPFNLRSVCTLDKKIKEKLLKGKSKSDYDEYTNNGRELEEMAVVTDEIENVAIESSKVVDDSNAESDDTDKKRKHKSSPSTLDRKKKKVKPDKNNESSMPSSDFNAQVNLLENANDKPVEEACTSPNEADQNVVSEKDMPIEHGEEPSDDRLLKTKMKRRQKKKQKKLRSTAYSGMMILSKADWKKLRNMYLNSQRAKMRLLKKHLCKCKQHAENYEDDQFAEGNLHSTFATANSGMTLKKSIEVPNTVVKLMLNEPVIDVKGFKNDIKSRSDSVMNIDVKEGVTEVHVRFSTAAAAENFLSSNSSFNGSVIKGQEEQNYWLKIHRDRENKKDKRDKKNEKMEDDAVQNNDISFDQGSNDKKIPKALLEKPTLTILPGTVVKIEIPEPIVDVKHFKSGIKKSYKDAVYVDVNEGATEAYVRFNTPENSLAFTTSNPFDCTKVLTGDEEQSYWSKINEDRTNKFNKNVRINRRGKQKIIKKAEKMMGKHIILGDPEDIDSTVADCECVEAV